MEDVRGLGGLVCSYPLRKGNTFTPLVDGIPAFTTITRAARSARHSVYVVVAFIELDVILPGTEGNFFDLMDEIHAKGIDVRVLFWSNPAFSGNFSGEAAQLDYLRKRGSTFAMRFDESPSRPHCHHQKTWIIDAGYETEIAFVGGINIDHGEITSPEHSPKPRGFNNIHDIYAEIRGPAGTDVFHCFVQRWNEANGGRCWPNKEKAHAMEFPTKLSAEHGYAFVQISRNISPGLYSDSTPPPAHTIPSISSPPYDISLGESSILEHYKLAIQSAKRSIYFENQHFFHSDLLANYLIPALKRGVAVVAVMPVIPMGAIEKARSKVDAYKEKKNEKTKNEKGKEEGWKEFFAPPSGHKKGEEEEGGGGRDIVLEEEAPRYLEDFEKFVELGNYENFMFCGLAVNVSEKEMKEDHVWCATTKQEGKRPYQHIYVHSKLLIVDDEWITIGSANLVDLSLDKDHTEVNASCWHGPTAKALRVRLFAEHLQIPESQLGDEGQDYTRWGEMAKANRKHWHHNEPLEGRPVKMDPGIFATPHHRKIFGGKH